MLSPAGELVIFALDLLVVVDHVDRITNDRGGQAVDGAYQDDVVAFLYRVVYLVHDGRHLYRP